MTCKWDHDRETYLVDGEPCKRDAYGDPTRHCTARRTCANHVGHDELTCARCLGRTRADIRAVRDLAPLMMTVALGAGVNSEAASLAGPATDVEAWSWRKVAAKQGRAWHLSMIEDDDDHHPYTVLCRWQMMFSEDYGHDLPDVMTTASAAAYLERTLPRIAQDQDQDFPLFAREIRRCRTHLESVIHNSMTPERGAPCPRCDPPAPRLSREYAHWCDDAECLRFHHPDDRDDRWVCPRNHEHVWAEAEYRLWVADVYAEARRDTSA